MNAKIVKYGIAKKDVTILPKANTYVSFSADDLGIPVGSKLQFEICVIDNAWNLVYIVDTFSASEITSLDDTIVRATISSQRTENQNAYVECRFAYI